MIETRLVMIALAGSAMLAGQAVAAQSSGPNAEVQAAVDAALDAARSGDIATLRGQYAPDCVFVDEFAPFRWSGPKAIDAYLASAAQMYRETRHGGVTMTVGKPTYVYVSGDSAYVIEPLTETTTVGGRPYQSAGALAFTLARMDRGGKITSQTWGNFRDTIRNLSSNLSAY